ncbi:serine dehydratase [Ensifer adhaerens]|uniref:L-serine ammonia-lyase n=1 Tax=Ensifer adhaerens TaxID=106592 RepID=A0A0L8BH25_ENSAD|nr:pyridoxal-phosphate dependent enzyme [Ensifer adhaerens]KOF13874.1 serine dehydratase [Ensifer adhaerens]
MPLHFKTPTYVSASLSKACGRNVSIKLDSLQPSGSFKIRGIGLACEEHARRGVKRFVSSSGGNAGVAVAYAGRQLGIPVTVVVPETTSERAQQTISNLEAQVVVHGASWQEANDLAMSMLDIADAFIHPFDDPLLWKGHSTIIDEIVEDGLRPDAIVLSVGGGGLLSGVVEGLQRHRLDIPVLAVETLGASSFAQSVAAGQRVVLPTIASVATSLGARQVSEHAFALTRQYHIDCAVVSDLQAVDASLRFLDDHRIMVEPACGASLAAIYENLEQIHGWVNIMVIVCGGITSTPEQLQFWKQDLSGA